MDYYAAADSVYVCVWRERGWLQYTERLPNPADAQRGITLKTITHERWEGSKTKQKKPHKNKVWL